MSSKWNELLWGGGALAPISGMRYIKVIGALFMLLSVGCQSSGERVPGEPVQVSI